MKQRPLMCSVCHCDLEKGRDHECSSGIHLPHPMEPIGDSGYFYCPRHDRVRGAVWTEGR